MLPVARDSRYIQRGSHYETACNKDDKLHIPFVCESCGTAAEFELVIIDYKGNVFVEWRELP